MADLVDEPGLGRADREVALLEVLTAAHQQVTTGHAYRGVGKAGYEFRDALRAVVETGDAYSVDEMAHRSPRSGRSYWLDVRATRLGDGWKVSLVTLMNERLAVGGATGGGKFRGQWCGQ